LEKPVVVRGAEVKKLEETLAEFVTTAGAEYRVEPAQ
jgi:hypothetical protein